MTAKTKVSLITCVVCLIVGLAFFAGVVSVHSAKALYVVLPIGATFFGVFMVFRVFEKETEQYDQEQHASLTSGRISAKKGH